MICYKYESDNGELIIDLLLRSIYEKDQQNIIKKKKNGQDECIIYFQCRYIGWRNTVVS